ncbi:MAG: YfiR family protein [Candidatus Competibacteraceae bacterium]|nr:YfiR family protein [Candidatus Competibacteraceae bacterium]HRY16062.1 YfiR family protein [Candidatus Competibacteraceae bacterium]
MITQAALQILLLAIAWLPLAASALAADEYAIKAAYLYNFAKFIEWPPNSFTKDDAPLNICIIGDHSFDDALARLRGKAVGSHPVFVQEFPAGSDAPGCHIVFISRSQEPRLRNLLATFSKRPALTVSDIEDFAQRGGIIGLIEVEQRIQFAINLAAMRRAGLKLSSQLLKLAIIVDEGNKEP